MGAFGKSQEMSSRPARILAWFRAHLSRNLTANHDPAIFDYNEQLSPRNKNAIGLIIASILLLLMAAFVVFIGLQRQFADAYLATNVSIKSFDNNHQEWRVTSARESECPDKRDCYGYLKQKPLRVRSYQELTRPWSDIQPDPENKEPIYILVQTTIETSAWKSLYHLGQSQVIVGLPSAWYQKASVYVNEDLVGKFVDDSHIGASVDLNQVPKMLVVDVVYLKESDHLGVFDAAEDYPLLVASPANYRAFNRILVMQSAQRGNWLSNLSFIVMAIFFLLLYLLVDRSPEVLGLALYVGLDAFARSLSYDWLPTLYSDQISDTADSMAQIIRLYFTFQLCRIGSSRIAPWLAAAVIYSVVVSFGSWVNVLGWPIVKDRVYEINAWCALIVAVIGVFLTGFTLFKIRGANQIWRKWALLIAMVSCCFYAASYLNHILPELQNSPIFLKTRSILIPLSVFLLASSAFVNISTLENRVRVLSDVKAKNDEIKKELELGRIVQSAYMKVPELPAYVDLACYFEAAFYVSGDAYFVHWDESTGRLAVIVGDMTGHGVQAALKASTLQVMAQTIFSDSMRRAGDLGARFVVYEQAVRSFLSDSWKEGDFPTFLGIEIEISTGKVVSHRCNFPFPMIVEQREDGRWLASVWVDQTLTLDAKKSDRRVFFVSASDGVISGSKMFHKVARDLENKLNSAKLVSAELIKQEILDYLKHAGAGSNDDRTMVVFGTKSNSSAA